MYWFDYIRINLTWVLYEIAVKQCGFLNCFEEVCTFCVCSSGFFEFLGGNIFSIFLILLLNFTVVEHWMFEILM